MPTEMIWLEQKHLELMRMSPDALRETVLDNAVRASKIPPERIGIYRDMYDRDPRGTTTLINNLVPGVPPEAAVALAAFAAQQSPYPRELFPELARRPRAAPSPAITLASEQPPLHSSPATEAPAPHATPAEQLFPEVRERRTAHGRITRADD